MFNLSFNEILKKTNGIKKNITQEQENMPFNELYINDKETTKNSIFLAIVGKNFDGHNFCKSAIKKGASFAITEREIKNIPQIIVKNTKKALIEISALNRSFFKENLVGITGSVGKTTTKDMLATILNSSFKTLKTFGNYNNEIGMPKTILKLNPSFKACVVEMGMSNFGEIKTLSKACCPTVGIITKIGTSHIEFLKTKENILKAKLEILEGMQKNAPLILNGEDQLLKNLHFKDHETILCGTENENNRYFAKNIKQNKLKTSYNLYEKEKFLTEIELPTIGKHNVLNSLLAIAAAIYCKVPLEKIKESLKNFTPFKLRQNIHNVNNITFIADCYNASPESVVAAIEILNNIKNKGKKIAVLGDMLELGNFSSKAHFSVGEFAMRNYVDVLFCYGDNSKNTILGAKDELKNKNHNINKKIKHFTEKKDLIKEIKETLNEGDVILFKASLGMNFEEIFNAIFNEYDKQT